MTRTLVLLSILLVAACAPVASAPTPSATIPPATTPSLAPTAPPESPTTTASPTPITLPSIAYIAAAGNGVIWALVGGTRIFVSNDRGDTWAERALPANVPSSGIAFVSATEGWLLAAASPGTQCQAQTVAIWHTSDGARSWQALTFSGIADAQCKDQLAFNSAQRGYLSAWDPNGAPTVYRTSDGGKTWSGARLPDPPGFTTQPGGNALRAGSVADFGSALYVDAFGSANGKRVDHVFRSTDGGASWAFAGTAPTSETGVTFISAARWIEILVPSPSAETTDGGSTWHPFASDYQQAAPIAPQIVFGDANNGYATVRGAIQRTTDGGAHWSSIKTPGT